MYFCFTAFPRSLRQIWHIYYFVVEAVFFQLISVGIMYYQPPCLNSLYQLASCVISHPVSTADISQHHMLSATLSQQLISVGIMYYQPSCLNCFRLFIVFNSVAFKIFFGPEDTYQFLGDTRMRDYHNQSILFSCEFIRDFNVHSQRTLQFL